MKNLKTFAKANETLTKEALLTVKGGDKELSFENALIVFFTEQLDRRPKLKSTGNTTVIEQAVNS